MLNQQLQSSLNDAFTYAHELSHEFVTLEHLLLVLLENPQVTEILDACNGNIESLKEDLLMYIHESNDEIENEADLNVQPTLGFQRVIQRAIYQVQSSGQDEVTGGHIIVSMYSEPESQAVYLLEQQKIDRLDVVTYMSHGMSDDSFENVMALIEREPAQAPQVTMRSEADIPSALSDYIGGSLKDIKWRPIGLGVKQSLLKTSGNSTARLLYIPAGTAVPHHSHNGNELTLVLKGAFEDEVSRFGPGDVEMADEDLDHQPIAVEGEDCICLAVTDAPLKFQTLLHKLVQPFLKI